MDISSVLSMQTQQLRQAISYTMINKIVRNDVAELRMIKEMSSDVAQMTGKGQNIDIKI